MHVEGVGAMPVGWRSLSARISDKLCMSSQLSYLECRYKIVRFSLYKIATRNSQDLGSRPTFLANISPQLLPEQP